MVIIYKVLFMTYCKNSANEHNASLLACRTASVAHFQNLHIAKLELFRYDTNFSCYLLHFSNKNLTFAK